MSINSLNPVSPVFKGRTLPRFVNSHYINMDHRRAYSVFLHNHVHHLELYMVLEGQARYFIDDKYYTLQRGDIAIINQGGHSWRKPDVRHGQQFDQRRSFQPVYRRHAGKLHD